MPERRRGKEVDDDGFRQEDPPGRGPGWLRGGEMDYDQLLAHYQTGEEETPLPEHREKKPFIRSLLSDVKNEGKFTKKKGPRPAQEPEPGEEAPAEGEAPAPALPAEVPEPAPAEAPAAEGKAPEPQGPSWQAAMEAYLSRVRREEQERSPAPAEDPEPVDLEELRPGPKAPSGPEKWDRILEKWPEEAPAEEAAPEGAEAPAPEPVLPEDKTPGTTPEPVRRRLRSPFPYRRRKSAGNPPPPSRRRPPEPVPAEEKAPEPAPEPAPAEKPERPGKPGLLERLRQLARSTRAPGGDEEEDLSEAQEPEEIPAEEAAPASAEAPAPEPVSPEDKTPVTTPEPAPAEAPEPLPAPKKKKCRKPAPALPEEAPEPAPAEEKAPEPAPEPAPEEAPAAAPKVAEPPREKPPRKGKPALGKALSVLGKHGGKKPGKAPKPHREAPAAEGKEPRRAPTPLEWVYIETYYIGIQLMRDVHLMRREAMKTLSWLAREVPAWVLAQRRRFLRLTDRISEKTLAPYRELARRTGQLRRGLRSIGRGKGAGHARRELWREYLSALSRPLNQIANFVAPIVGITILAATVNYFTDLDFALSVEYSGQNLGCIAHESVFYDAQQSVLDRMINEEYLAPENAGQPVFRIVIADEEDLVDQETLANRIITISQNEVQEADGVYIEGAFLGALEDGNEFLMYIDNVLETYRTGIEHELVQFVKGITVRRGIYPKSSVVPLHEITDDMESEETRTVEYTVRDGDTLSQIAAEHNTSVEQLLELNPGLEFREPVPVEEPEEPDGSAESEEAGDTGDEDAEDGEAEIDYEIPLWEGETLTVAEVNMSLEVQVTRRETYVENIPYGTTTVEDDRYYKGYEVTLSAGVYGQQEGHRRRHLYRRRAGRGKPHRHPRGPLRAGERAGAGGHPAHPHLPAQRRQQQRFLHVAGEGRLCNRRPLRLSRPHRHGHRRPRGHRDPRRQGRPGHLRHQLCHLALRQAGADEPRRRRHHPLRPLQRRLRHRGPVCPPGRPYRPGGTHRQRHRQPPPLRDQDQRRHHEPRQLHRHLLAGVLAEGEKGPPPEGGGPFPFPLSQHLRQHPVPDAGDGGVVDGGAAEGLQLPVDLSGPGEEPHRLRLHLPGGFPQEGAPGPALPEEGLVGEASGVDPPRPGELPGGLLPPGEEAQSQLGEEEMVQLPPGEAGAGAGDRPEPRLQSQLPQGVQEEAGGRPPAVFQGHRPGGQGRRRLPQEEPPLPGDGGEETAPPPAPGGRASPGGGIPAGPAAGRSPAPAPGPGRRSPPRGALPPGPPRPGGIPGPLCAAAPPPGPGAASSSRASRSRAQSAAGQRETTRSQAPGQKGSRAWGRGWRRRRRAPAGGRRPGSPGSRCRGSPPPPPPAPPPPGSAGRGGWTSPSRAPLSGASAAAAPAPPAGRTGSDTPRGRSPPEKTAAFPPWTAPPSRGSRPRFPHPMRGRGDLPPPAGAGKGQAGKKPAATPEPVLLPRPRGGGMPAGRRPGGRGGEGPLLSGARPAPGQRKRPRMVRGLCGADGGAEGQRPP